MDLHTRIRQLELIGSAERPIADVPHDVLLVEVLAILDAPDFGALSCDERAAMLFRVLLLYSNPAAGHSSGRKTIASVQRAARALFDDDSAPLNALCVAYDLLYFLYWCWDTDLDRQVPCGPDVVAPFCAAIRRRNARDGRDTETAGNLAPWVHGNHPRRIGYLAEFVTPGPGNAIAGANKVLLTSLAERRPRIRPILYAWMFHDPETLDAYRALGIEVRAITGNSTAERVDAVRKLIAEDAPDVLITDMNASLPTVLFAERAAPIQVFYQFGMPVWPVREVDAIFHVWDFDFDKAGLAGRPATQLMIPYDLPRFAGPADPALLERERADLPRGRLIGTYGRLSKITPQFIEAVAAGIAGISDVTVVFGGSGDPRPIRDAVARLGLERRFVVVDRFVDGHTWGHLLDVFLDTFPQPGGASCLEVIAKGKPVISLVTPDAPNLALQQRVNALVATDAIGYAAILDRLLADPGFYAEACQQTRQLVATYPDTASYRQDLGNAIESLCLQKWPPMLPQRIWSGMRHLTSWHRR